MQNKILKLIFPQWQGGIIAHWFKDLAPESAARGYYLGAQMLDLALDSIPQMRHKGIYALKALNFA